jgi:TolB protein
VFYVSGRGDRRALRAVQVETGESRAVLPLATTEHDVLRPRLSPDGTHLAYTRSQEGQLEVWMRSMKDGSAQRVARLGDGVAFPIWSPDGRSLAVDVWRDGHAQAHVVDLASGGVTQISRDVEQAWVRSWSPDSERVVFAAASQGRWNVWWAARDGRAQRQLTQYADEHHYVRNPDWSPKGDRLVYEFASFAGNIWTIRLD